MRDRIDWENRTEVTVYPGGQVIVAGAEFTGVWAAWEVIECLDRESDEYLRLLMIRFPELAQMIAKIFRERARGKRCQ